MLQLAKGARSNDVVRVGDYYYPAKTYNQVIRMAPRNSEWFIDDTTLKINWGVGEVGIYNLLVTEVTLDSKVIYRRAGDPRNIYEGLNIINREYFGGKLAVF
jgi:hypothetical protein